MSERRTWEAHDLCPPSKRLHELGDSWQSFDWRAD
jgi:hypothetical protein